MDNKSFAEIYRNKLIEKYGLQKGGSNSGRYPQAGGQDTTHLGMMARWKAARSAKRAQAHSEHIKRITSNK